MTEKEFSEKYCKVCSSLVCTGTEEEAAKGCKDYQKEVLGWQELKDFKVPNLKFDKIKNGWIKLEVIHILILKMMYLF